MKKSPEPETPKRLLTIAEFSKILGVNRHQVGEYVRDGLIRVILWPGSTRYRFLIEDVEAFIEASRVAVRTNGTSS